MGKYWYTKEFKEKLALLRKLYDEETDPDKKWIMEDTMEVIESILIVEKDSNKLIDILENDIEDLTESKFMWKYVRKLAEIDTQEKVKIDNRVISFSQDDIIELLHLFFKNGTNKEMYKQFLKVYEHNKERIRLLNTMDQKSAGETIYLDYFKDNFISVFKRREFSDLTTFAHEFGHAMQFSMNFNNGFYEELYVYIEIVSTFFELICNEYFVESEFKKLASANSVYNLKSTLKDARYLTKELDILNLIKYNRYDNHKTIRNNINDVIKELTGQEKDKILKYRPGQSYIYLIAFLIATNLFMIYKEDPDKAFYILNMIINLDGFLTCKEYYRCLNALEVLDVNKSAEYQEYVLKRCRK